MIITRGIRFSKLMRWSWTYIVWLLAFSGGVATLYYYDILNIDIPWLPVSVIGTAVAFFVGFKNNQAYDRMWEARKIWGGIVNESRTWGMQVDGYITDHFNKEVSVEEIKQIKQKLIYRHIAWLFAHRSQLLIPAPWEHINQGGRVTRIASRYQKRFGIGLVVDEAIRTELKHYLQEDELKELIESQNTATQIVNRQSRELTLLRKDNIIDNFRHVELMETLGKFYDLQGKNERIKKFPLPRQYADISRYFVGIFLLFLPFSMVPELMKLGEFGFWLSIPITALIGWVYVMMELVGEYTENPFQGMAFDIPLLSLCRTIEIDLREMLGETELPKPITPKNDILM